VFRELTVIDTHNDCTVIFWSFPVTFDYTLHYIIIIYHYLFIIIQMRVTLNRSNNVLFGV